MMDVLGSLEKHMYLPDTNHYIEDDRLIKNGFRVRQIGGRFECLQQWGGWDFERILSCSLLALTRQ
jgi:hypothetical protein